MPKKKVVKKAKEVVDHAEGKAVPRDAEDPKEEKAVEVPAEAPAKKPALPSCGPNQRYFEAPDGRIYVGPRDASSIPDPLNEDVEINPKR